MALTDVLADLGILQFEVISQFLGVEDIGNRNAVFLQDELLLV